MKDYEISYLKKRLVSEKEIAQERLKINQEFLESLNIKKDLSELSSYDNHPADSGSELFEREKGFALEKHNSEYLKDVEESLEKIGDGSYGICDFCGGDIGFERLDAYPIAKLCIHCQNNKTINAHEWDDDRPVEEKMLGYPFSRTFTDNTDNVVYDGEDAWQDVQRYGSSSGPQDISVNRPIDYENIYIGSEEKDGLVERVESIDNEDYQEQLPDE